MVDSSVFLNSTRNRLESPAALDLRSGYRKLVIECVVLDNYRHITCSETCECVICLLEAVCCIELCPSIKSIYGFLSIECCLCLLIVVVVKTLLEKEHSECVTRLCDSRYLSCSACTCHYREDKTNFKVVSLKCWQTVKKSVPSVKICCWVDTVLAEDIRTIEQHWECLVTWKTVCTAVVLIKNSSVVCKT